MPAWIASASGTKANCPSATRVPAGNSSTCAFPEVMRRSTSESAGPACGEGLAPARPARSPAGRRAAASRTARTAATCSAVSALRSPPGSEKTAGRSATATLPPSFTICVCSPTSTATGASSSTWSSSVPAQRPSAATGTVYTASIGACTTRPRSSASLPAAIASAANTYSPLGPSSSRSGGTRYTPGSPPAGSCTTSSAATGCSWPGAVSWMAAR